MGVFRGMDSLDFVLETLNANRNRPFVKRILDPDKFPSLDLGKGKRATHLMSWGQVGDKYVVFPTVLYDGKQLTRMGPDEAWRNVSKTDNFIEFSTAEEAERFSKEYKEYWERGSLGVE